MLDRLKQERECRPATARVLLAFAAIYLIWGTTYLAMRVAVETIPPFLMAGTRFLIAGSILMIVMRLRGIGWPTWLQWRSAAIVGCLLMVGGNGLVTWSEQEIPSGIAALVVATMPLWMTLFDWLLFGGPRPGWQVTAGLCAGFGGIVLLIGPREMLTGEMTLDPVSLIVLMFAPVFWSLGSLISREASLPPNVFMSVAAQMLAGGTVLVLIAAATGEPGRLDVYQVSRNSLLAMAYLTLFGSMIALTSYVWLLKRTTAARVATYTYVNPVIAVFLGWLILGEVVTARTLLAVVVIVVAVVLIVTRRYGSPPQEQQA